MPVLSRQLCAQSLCILRRESGGVQLDCRIFSSVSTCFNWPLRSVDDESFGHLCVSFYTFALARLQGLTVVRCPAPLAIFPPCRPMCAVYTNNTRKFK
jgi:hypothetical protein